MEGKDIKRYESIKYSNCYGTLISFTELEEATQLIPSCIDGCFRAQTRLYHIFAKPMLSLCLRLTNGDNHKAQDIAQDAFAKVFGHLQTLKSERSLHVWVTRIFYSEALDAFRKSRREKHRLNYFYTPINEEITIVSNEPDIEFSHDLDMLLCRYVHRHRNIFRMVANGYTYTDIGQELQMSEGTVKSIISRERARIRYSRDQYLQVLF